MKNILVPTDFSENANLALKYAIPVVNQFGGTLNVLHVYQILTTTGSLLSIDQIVKRDREEEVSVLIEENKPMLVNNAKMEGHVRKGDSVENIFQMGDQLNADLIIMGTKGADGMKKMFLGSTASNVILDSSIPVLVVPGGFENFNISNITLALDDKIIEDLTILNPILSLAKEFGASLNLLTIIQENQSVMKMDQNLESYLNSHGVTYTHFNEKSSDIIKGIQNFVAQQKSDLLCLIHRPRGFFQSIFDQSVSKEMAFDSKIPLLVIRK